MPEDQVGSQQLNVSSLLSRHPLQVRTSARSIPLPVGRDVLARAVVAAERPVSVVRSHRRNRDHSPTPPASGGSAT